MQSQNWHDHPSHGSDPGGVRLSGLPGAKEDNLPREKLWLQTKFTALRGQDPRRIPYDPKVRQGSTTGPWLTMRDPTTIFFSLFGGPQSLTHTFHGQPKILEFISWGLFPGAIGHSSGTVHPKIFAKSGHLLSWLLGDAFAHAHLGRELGGGNLWLFLAEVLKRSRRERESHMLKWDFDLASFNHPWSIECVSWSAQFADRVLDLLRWCRCGVCSSAWSAQLAIFAGL